ncbi:MAG TPA: aminotransferase class I/II-fold pyridoxal phosphate-dependent enzyme, partial [Verrucomicrobiae bacterium]|nr:aminotransferase class I/II-fold pyridoxal phosphate-dependent enzyme [Verrucomicrobiae bacterium]
MTAFHDDLSQRLKAIRADGLYRELREVESPQGTHVIVEGKRLLNFSSNDYLGLANHPSVKSAAHEAIDKSGAGSGSARLICGSLKVHHDLETALAEFKGTEAALAFSSGYATAVGTICALLQKADVIIIDRLVHACIVDAAKLCGTKLRIFAHNDSTELEHCLKWAREKKFERILIVTESVFSMDGDLAPLREIVELKDRYGAWLMLDEAHATGLFGAKRRGLAEAFDLADRVE